MNWWDLLLGRKLSDSEERQLARYTRLVAKFGLGGTSGFDALQVLERRYSIDGDHLTVASVSGSIPLAVRVTNGPDENPYIPLRQGMVVTRKFREISVRVASPRGFLDYNPFRVGSCELYVSKGPLLELPAPQRGFRRGFVGLEVTIPPGDAARLFDMLEEVLPDGFTGTVGRFGGTLILTNTSPGTVRISSFGNDASPPTPPPTMGYPLLPGASITLELEDPILGDADVSNSGIYVEGAAGSTLGVLLSDSGADALAPEQLTTITPGLS